MKKLYAATITFFAFICVVFASFAAKTSHSVAVLPQFNSKISVLQDTTKNDYYNFTLRDTRKNKPKIFQDPIKTYDKSQLAFFTTFGFNNFKFSGLADATEPIQPQKIIYNFKIYPNPVNVNTHNLKISYSINKNALVTVKMLDILGNEVSTLFSQNVPAGKKTNEFNISNKVSSGFYFIRLTADNDHVTKKLSVVQ